MATLGRKSLAMTSPVCSCVCLSRSHSISRMITGNTQASPIACDERKRQLGVKIWVHQHRVLISRPGHDNMYCENWVNLFVSNMQSVSE